MLLILTAALAHAACTPRALPRPRERQVVLDSVAITVSSAARCEGEEWAMVLDAALTVEDGPVILPLTFDYGYEGEGVKEGGLMGGGTTYFPRWVKEETGAQRRFHERSPSVPTGWKLQQDLSLSFRLDYDQPETRVEISARLDTSRRRPRLAIDAVAVRPDGYSVEALY